MNYAEVIAALRSAPSRSKRYLFDTAADMIEKMDKDLRELRNEQEERSKGCHNCYGNDMAIDAVDNPCWNCKGDHSEWREGDDPSQIEKLAARYERNMHKPWKKPMTNADRIRAMSDEELSVFLWSFDVVDIAMEEDGTALLRPKLTKWLQQPADHAEVASDVLMRPDGEEG